MCLVLRRERRGRDLRHHEAAVQPAAAHEESRQAAQVRVDQQRDATLGQRADLGNRQGQVVGRQRDRLRVEVAAGQHGPGVGEYERVVGHRVGFRLEHAADMTQDVETGAHHLRLAADRVRILHPVATYVRGPDFAAGHQLPEHGGDGDLAAVAPDALDALVERRVATADRIRRHRAGNQRR